MDVNTANQSTTDEQMMDILLVLDKEKKTISAVKGVDENGELQTVPPENNSELLKFDRHGDFFSNFFSNMMNPASPATAFPPPARLRTAPVKSWIRAVSSANTSWLLLTIFSVVVAICRLKIV